MSWCEPMAFGGGMNLSDGRFLCSTLFSNSRFIFRHMRSMKISRWSSVLMPGGRVPPSRPPTLSHVLPLSHQFRTLSLKFSFCFLSTELLVSWAHLLYSITIPFIPRSRMPEFIMIGFLRVTLRSLASEKNKKSESAEIVTFPRHLNSPHSHSQSTKAALAFVMESWSNILKSTPSST